ncbi:MAG: DUF5682 family protein, partial [Streptosporangiaceae bacterium]
MSVTLLGVRHHGPGSARAVLAALTVLEPDVILIEGPPEAGALLRYVPGLVPPVAIPAHAADRPGEAAFWPFAEFSPEWQAIGYAVAAGREARFIDLPAAVTLAARDDGRSPAATISGDPLGWLSQAAGHDDPERWWEDVVEHRLGGDPLELFAAVAVAMTELRAAARADGWTEPASEQRREAAMRQAIRTAVREGHRAVAVVCGAWHVPALAVLPPARADADLLRGLPKVKASATWVPWTSRRLTYDSGYGAGVRSPGWNGHLWRAGDHIAERWVARVSALLREAGLAASPASAVETVRLAEAVAALRGRSLPGLSELTDAALAVLCQGDRVPLALIDDKLVVGEDLGRVPPDVPTVPLHADFEATCRRLRFRPAAGDRLIELDLRKDTDQARSRLLHRLRLLGIGWGEPSGAESSGTFREGWLLRWRPEFVVSLIEQARYGTTVPAAATAVVAERANAAADFPRLTALVEEAVLADLPDAMPSVTQALERRSARTGDIAHLMAATPPLARVVRYGSVRQTGTDLVAIVLDSILVRICAGLAAACVGLDEQAAWAMLAAMEAADGAVALTGSAGQRAAWQGAQRAVADLRSAPPVLAGRCVRLLLDTGLLTAGEAQQRLARALSSGAAAVAWLEGFLRGNGTLLLRDEPLWGLLDDWLTGLAAESFDAALPLLRRAFTQFTQPERRQMAANVRSGRASGPGGDGRASGPGGDGRAGA